MRTPLRAIMMPACAPSVRVGADAAIQTGRLQQDSSTAVGRIGADADRIIGRERLIAGLNVQRTLRRGEREYNRIMDKETGLAKLAELGVNTPSRPGPNWGGIITSGLSDIVSSGYDLYRSMNEWDNSKPPKQHGGTWRVGGTRPYGVPSGSTWSKPKTGSGEKLTF